MCLPQHRKEEGVRYLDRRRGTDTYPPLGGSLSLGQKWGSSAHMEQWTGHCTILLAHFWVRTQMGSCLLSPSLVAAGARDFRSLPDDRPQRVPKTQPP